METKADAQNNTVTAAATKALMGGTYGRDTSVSTDKCGWQYDGRVTTEDLHDLDAVASLADRVRRQAYEVVADRAGAVGRDEVAEALGVGRTLAAFHLDKLVAAGLLEVSYARRSGKSGPGAGRPAKLYHLAAAEHAVSVPPRAYRAAAELLAEALKTAEAVASMAPLAAIATKEMVNAAYEMGLAQGIVFERRLFHGLFGTEDQKEGMSAFVDKRKADWTGR